MSDIDDFRKYVQKDIDNYVNTIYGLREENKALIARVRELEAALTFYSNPRDYEEYRPPNFTRHSAMEDDSGYTARRVLGCPDEQDIEYEVRMAQEAARAESDG